MKVSSNGRVALGHELLFTSILVHVYNNYKTCPMLFCHLSNFLCSNFDSNMKDIPSFVVGNSDMGIVNTRLVRKAFIVSIFKMTLGEANQRARHSHDEA